ncbi:pentapeptide repeat-containing protein [Rhodococcus sp. BP-349]|uniref:pentapeptide repeat-containing protein n=1 Tax=unclassified Rhodococcus (in: high G+C Gram-positive bacteria) TaxID=192944 RepID=UPI001DFF917F|nr:MULTISPECIES: pentapeptide repeat-containing protein [unclassified Rhodococcus (in: high G+C Gram-positive bacteria)]MBY6538442.1 pentapeptide repeat-containing protein [Rhodococcus sp. BP-363]MBY6542779.1 pentapeptide repeat-containing protein [Rhodococcus sp. BP-369]MBY6562009.1 pentapeptide repeat-containing protein [Rhodococcus sp. BP-370]MBY6576301.1 pentapeptide repeat-containing protein [Rhodococcus sp. BP-364]MBY6585602.1 pentapeptide repeat-containing protein [Rhodococcus sp. BP-35
MNEPFSAPVPDPSTLRADCARCTALCCTALGFSRSVEFATDKPPGVPCVHLDTTFRCSIHSALPRRGYRGCVSFDCFGAGQLVSTTMFPTTSWREGGATARTVFSTFEVVMDLHEMLWHLTRVRTRCHDCELTDEIDLLCAEIGGVVDAGAASVLAVDVASVRGRVRQVLDEVSDDVRAAYFADGARTDARLVPRADLAGADLRALRLCGANLRGSSLVGADLRRTDLAGCDLLGVDLRGADVRGADLRDALFLTRTQLASARGDRDTRVPLDLEGPSGW